MFTRLLIVIAIALALNCSTLHAEEAVEIPLDQIWALDMPGTRDVTTIEGKFNNRGRVDFFDRLRRGLWQKSPELEAKNGFVVEGTGALALLRSRTLFASRSGIWHAETHCTQAELSLVFFSHPSAYYVHLEHVERRGTEISVRYRLVPNFTGKVTVHLALIPLGYLPVGDYQVNMIQSPLEQEYLDAGFQPLSEEQTKRTVSQSFSFAVAELPDPDPGPAEDSIVIPLEEIWGYQLEGTRDIGTLDLEQLPQPLGTLSTRPLGAADQQDAQPGFAVLGTGQEALVAAHTELPAGEKPTNAFPAGSEISLVFFSQGKPAPFIVLDRVERRGPMIDIRYRVASTTSSGSQPFALIPMGKLPAGAYQVNMIPTLSVDARIRPGSAGTEFVATLRRSVCQPFTFTVEGPSEPDSGPVDGAVEIPLESIWGFDRARRELEGDLFIQRDTPEKRAEYSTPEKLQEIRDKAHSSLTYQIERAMNDDVLDESDGTDYMKRQPAPGFAVAGQELEAWRGVHDVVVNQQPPQSEFSQEDEITLVFFTLISGQPLRLIRAERDSTTINVEYVLVVTGRPSSTPKLCMIPLGKLPSGKYSVKPIRMHEEEPKHSRRGFPTYEKGVEQHFVSRPFEFTVLENEAGRKGE